MDHQINIIFISLRSLLNYYKKLMSCAFLQDHPAMMGITVMRPSLRGLSERWICNYSTQTIIPPGLTSRDLKTLPPREYKKEGPTFGTNVGQGLMVGSIVKSNPHPPVLKCPSVLEVRQLVQSKPVSQELRER